MTKYFLEVRSDIILQSFQTPKLHYFIGKLAIDNTSSTIFVCYTD